MESPRNERQRKKNVAQKQDRKENVALKQGGKENVLQKNKEKIMWLQIMCQRKEEEKSAKSISRYNNSTLYILGKPKAKRPGRPRNKEVLILVAIVTWLFSIV